MIEFNVAAKPKTTFTSKTYEVDWDEVIEKKYQEMMNKNIEMMLAKQQAHQHLFQALLKNV